VEEEAPIEEDFLISFPEFDEVKRLLWHDGDFDDQCTAAYGASHIHVGDWDGLPPRVLQAEMREELEPEPELQEQAVSLLRGETDAEVPEESSSVGEQQVEVDGKQAAVPLSDAETGTEEPVDEKQALQLSDAETGTEEAEEEHVETSSDDAVDLEHTAELTKDIPSSPSLASSSPLDVSSDDVSEKDLEVPSADDAVQDHIPCSYRYDSWWGPADIHSARGLESAASLSSPPLQFQVVRHGNLSSRSARPWHANESQALYRQMGMRSPTSTYIAAWLNLNHISLMWVAEVLDEARVRLCASDDGLMSRLKLLLRPVHASIPFPVKGAPEADTIGVYFGLQSASIAEETSEDGIKHFCVQVDLYSKWALRLAMKNIGFREGNVLDMLFIDWPGQAVLASARLTVTAELLQLLA
jgi:hypothetical protein